MLDLPSLFEYNDAVIGSRRHIIYKLHAIPHISIKSIINVSLARVEDDGLYEDLLIYSINNNNIKLSIGTTITTGITYDTYWDVNPILGWCGILTI